MAAVRVVIDTNIVLSALLFQRGRLTWLRVLWTNGHITPLIDTPCADELMWVLAYPKFRLSASEIELLLGFYLPFTHTIEKPRPKLTSLPICTDTHDQNFCASPTTVMLELKLLATTPSWLSRGTLVRFNIKSPAQFRLSLKAP